MRSDDGFLASKASRREAGVELVDFPGMRERDGRGNG